MAKLYTNKFPKNVKKWGKNALQMFLGYVGQKTWQNATCNKSYEERSKS
jgi:hypothetical protein